MKFEVTDFDGCHCHEKMSIISDEFNVFVQILTAKLVSCLTRVDPKTIPPKYTYSRFYYASPRNFFSSCNPRLLMFDMYVIESISTGTILLHRFVTVTHFFLLSRTICKRSPDPDEKIGNPSNHAYPKYTNEFRRAIYRPLNLFRGFKCKQS